MNGHQINKSNKQVSHSKINNKIVGASAKRLCSNKGSNAGEVSKHDKNSKNNKCCCLCDHKWFARTLG